MLAQKYSKYVLTKSDLQAIKGIVKGEIDPLGKELEQHGIQLEQHGRQLEQQGKQLKQHGTLLYSLKKDQSIMLKMLDGEQMDQKKRIKRLEDRLGLTTVG